GTSEAGIQSDNNDLYITAQGHIGQWEGKTFDRLVDWSYELGIDAHSISADPKFANPPGPDGILGYSTQALGAPQILDDTAGGFNVAGIWERVDQSLGNAGFLESRPTAATSKYVKWDVSQLSPPPAIGQTIIYPFEAFWSAHQGLSSASYSYTG